MALLEVGVKRSIWWLLQGPSDATWGSRGPGLLCALGQNGGPGRSLAWGPGFRGEGAWAHSPEEAVLGGRGSCNAVWGSGEDGELGLEPRSDFRRGEESDGSPGLSQVVPGTSTGVGQLPWASAFSSMKRQH